MSKLIDSTSWVTNHVYMLENDKINKTMLIWSHGAVHIIIITIYAAATL